MKLTCVHFLHTEHAWSIDDELGSSQQFSGQLTGIDRSMISLSA